MMTGKVLLRDNRDLSQAEFQSALDVCARIRQLVEGRESYIAEHNLDREFCLPDGLWSGTAFNDYLNTFREVITGRYEIVNRLRLFTSFFSGYSLRRLSGVPGEPSFQAITPDLDNQLATLLNKPDEWVGRWYRLAASVPREYLLSPPRMLGEVGWDVDGIVVSHDTCVYQERINLMHDAAVFDWLQRRLEARGTLRILEIGAGYGGLAYGIKKLFPSCDYWICDIPESLLFSALYLTLTRPDSPAKFAEAAHAGFTYMPNYMIDKITGEFDLAINTLSFSEMSEHQLRVYAQKLAELLDTGILFEQNQDNRHLGLLCASDILRNYFPAHRAVVGTLTRHATQGHASLWSCEIGNFPVHYQGVNQSIRELAREAGWIAWRFKRVLGR